MKIFIILGFFGILTNAKYELELPSALNKCLGVPSLPNFDPARYFNGTWYLTHAQHGASASICRTVRTILQPDGSLDHIAYGYSPKGEKDIFYKIRCFGNVKKGKVFLNCKIIEGGDKKNRKFFIEGVVIETDYDHFSIFYRCALNRLRMGDNVLVLNRDKNSRAEDPLITKALAKAGLVLDKFISRSEFDCLPHPEE